MIPDITTIRLDDGARLVVRAFRDGAVSLEMMTESASFHLAMSREAAGDLINALTPERAVLIEVLDRLHAAAGAICPSPLMDDREIVADARDLRAALDDARQVLGVRASC